MLNDFEDKWGIMKKYNCLVNLIWLYMIDIFFNIMINFYKIKINFDRDKSSVCIIIFIKGK